MMKFMGAMAVFALMVPNNLFAQEAEPGAMTLAGADSVAQEGLTSCFDYYRFGSVPVTISANLTEVAPGAEAAFSGKMVNENAYPLTDVTVYAKVFRINEDGTTSSYGPDLIDFFPVIEGVALAPQEEKALAFTWQAPEWLPKGTYQVATYVVDHQRFNYLGLSFTNDIVGGSATFKAATQNVGAVMFDKTAITVNQESFYAAAFPPRVAGGPAGVTASIENTTDKAFRGSVAWKVYSWDGLQESARLDEGSDEVKIQPGEEASVSFDVEDEDHPVYFVVGALSDEAGKVVSLIHVRFVRADVNSARINSIGITPYPGSGEASAFVCVHANGTAPLENGKVVLSVSRTGFWGFLGSVASKTYTGLIPGEVSAVAAPLADASGNYVLSAKLYQDGSLIDEASATYCNDASACEDSFIPTLIVLLLGLVVVSILVLVLRRRKRDPVAPRSSNLTV